MTEEQAILEDLKEYLKTRDMWTEVAYGHVLGWNIAQAEFQGSRYYYSVFDGQIGMKSSVREEPIVSLADPKYREKFYEYLKNNKMGLKRMETK